MHLAVPDLDDSQHDALALQTTEDVLKMLFKDKIFFKKHYIVKRMPLNKISFQRYSLSNYNFSKNIFKNLEKKITVSAICRLARNRLA